MAAFNRRAVTVYQRAGFRQAEHFEHVTNGALHAFIRMARATIESPARPGSIASVHVSPLQRAAAAEE